MNYKRRIIFYLFGVSLGVLVSYAFFSDRNYEFNYFPNARILSHLQKANLYISNKAEDKCKRLKIDSLMIVNMLDQGIVDISESNKSEKIYLLKKDTLNAYFQIIRGSSEEKDSTLLLDIWINN